MTYINIGLRGEEAVSNFGQKRFEIFDVFKGNMKINRLLQPICVPFCGDPSKMLKKVEKIEKMLKIGVFDPKIGKF